MKWYCFVLLLWIYSNGCCTIKPGFPNPQPQPVSFDAPPKSVINLPVSVDFSGKVQEIDQLVNAQFPFSGEQDDCNLRYSYAVHKTAPLAIALSEDPNRPVNFSTQLSVGAGITYCAVCANWFGRRCVVPKVSASCGIGEPPRKVKVSFASLLDLNPNYTLRSDVQVRDLYFIDPCRVTFLNINISGIIENQARRRIPLDAVNQAISSISVRQPVQNFWELLSTKLEVDDGLFLKIHPEQLSKGPVSGSGQVLQTVVGLQASPEITTDSTTPSLPPLPDLAPVSGANGFNLYTDIKIQYAYLSSKLTDALKDNTIEVGGKKIVIKKIETFGTKNRELILRVNFKGDVCGNIYLLGTPDYDSTNRVISFMNIQYDVITSNLLANTAAWLLQPIILRKIEEKAKVSISSMIDQNIVKTTAYLNQEFQNGISTEGRIASINIIPNNFQALPQFFLIRAHALGELKVKLKLQEVSLK